MSPEVVTRKPVFITTYLKDIKPYEVISFEELKTPTGKTVGNLNAGKIYFYRIRSLTLWQDNWEYRSLSIYEEAL